MSGISITKQQVKLYMSYRKNHSQIKSAAKAGISERSARRIENKALLHLECPRYDSTDEFRFNGFLAEARPLRVYPCIYPFVRDGFDKDRRS